MSSFSYQLDSRSGRGATVSRMRMLTGDAYTETGRALFNDGEMLWFITELAPNWNTIARRALGFLNPDNLPPVASAEDDRLAGAESDFTQWNDLVRRASAEACLSLSMRNPEWSPGRHSAYRTRAAELLPAIIDSPRY